MSISTVNVTKRFHHLSQRRLGLFVSVNLLPFENSSKSNLSLLEIIINFSYCIN